MDLRGGWAGSSVFHPDPHWPLAFLCTAVFISGLGLTFFEGYVKRKGHLIAQTLHSSV